MPLTKERQIFQIVYQISNSKMQLCAEKLVSRFELCSDLINMCSNAAESMILKQFEPKKGGWSEIASQLIVLAL